MTRTLLLLVAGLAVGLPGLARADVVRKCKDATFYFTQDRGCVKRPAAPKLSPVESYLKALDAIDDDPRKAFGLFEAACKQKHGPACTEVALFHQSGRGRVVAKDPKKSLEFFERGCELGDGAACQRRGNAAQNANDYVAARQFFDRGCKRDDGAACAQLAYSHEQGFVGKADPATAKPIYAKAHRLLQAKCPGNALACWVRGLLHERGLGVAKDATVALASYRLACAGSYGDACVAVAQAVDKAKGPASEVNEALAKACELDNAHACTQAAARISDADHRSRRAFDLATRGCTLDAQECGMLAEMHNLGRGTPVDQRKATTTYQSACDAGEQRSCVSYALRLRDGTGTAVDGDKAGRLFAAACAASNALGCEESAIFLSNKKDDAKGFEAAQKGCKLGARHACFVTGWMLRHHRAGKEPKPSDEDAAKEGLGFLEQACDKDSNAGCNLAGDLHRRGLGTPKDLTKALERFRKACRADAPLGDACLAVAQLLTGGDGVAKDPKAAVEHAARGCRAEHDASCDWLPAAATEAELVRTAVRELDAGCRARNNTVCYTQAMLLGRGTAADDKPRAYELFAAACARKHKPSCANHAWTVYSGFGTPEDKAKGEQLYRQQCDEDLAISCLRIAEIVYARKDATASLRYAERACTLDVPDGCNHLAYLHYTAQLGMRWDVAAGAKYFTKACELGSPLGCANQAELLRYGINGPADAKKSYELYQQSCDAGQQAGCAGAAHFLSTGKGVAKDLARAQTLWRAACDAEVPDACVELAAQLETSGKGNASEIARMRLKAFSITQKHAETNPAYMYWLGTYHRDGTGTMKDPQKATEWFVKSCDGFDPLGCIAAGRALGTSASATDRDKARVYFERACAAGVEDGCAGLKTGVVAPKPVAKPKACGCGGEVAPGAEAGLLVLVIAALGRRRRRPAR